MTDLLAIVKLRCATGPFGATRSNVLWGTRFTSPTTKGNAVGNPDDWDAARGAFLAGVTLPERAAREAALARAFRTLGHVMHLIQDLAVPAHVRDDFRSHTEHLEPSQLLTPSRLTENAFEHFVRFNGALVDAAPPVDISFQGHVLTRFWDTDQYDGNNPSADLLQGLAEYTNANFASELTVFTEDVPGPRRFPYPRRTSTNLAAYQADPRGFPLGDCRAEDDRLDHVRHLSKLGDGEVLPRFAKVGLLAANLVEGPVPPPPAALVFQIDDCAHADYAAKLLPRATGYAAALLNYFVRGRFHVEPLPARLEDPAHLRLVTIRNLTQERMRGTITFYFDDDLDGQRKQAGDPIPVDIPPGGQVGGPDDPEGFRVGVPVLQTGPHLAVFRGDLGAEREIAVAVAQVDLPRRRAGSRCVAPGCGTAGPSTVRPGEARTAAALDTRGGNAGLWILAAVDAKGECPLGADCTRQLELGFGASTAASITCPSFPGAVACGEVFDLRVTPGGFVCFDLGLTGEEDLRRAVAAGLTCPD